MTPVRPDYQNGSLALISSIAAYFGAPTGHEPLPALDSLLEDGHYRSVILLLFDGLGNAALRDHLPEDSFLRRHLVTTLSASFPPTTTAATTALESGLSPAEHGWIGWSLWFPELGRIVALFPNRDSLTGEALPGRSAAERFMPYTTVFERINSAGQADAACISPYSDPAYKTLPEIEAAILSRCTAPGRHYLYGYWPEPDHTMHDTGVHADEVREIIRDLDRRTEAFAQSLPQDTLLLITADHGLIDVKNLVLEDHPELMQALERPPCVEARAAALYVREEYRARFPALFEAAFPGEFLLMTGDEAISSGLFGPGRAHPRLRQSVGDYFAVSLKDTCLLWKHDDHPLAASHAGLTADEMQVPLIVCRKADD